MAKTKEFLIKQIVEKRLIVKPAPAKVTIKPVPVTDIDQCVAELEAAQALGNSAKVRELLQKDFVYPLDPAFVHVLSPHEFIPDKVFPNKTNPKWTITQRDMHEKHDVRSTQDALTLAGRLDFAKFGLQAEKCIAQAAASQIQEKGFLVKRTLTQVKKDKITRTVNEIPAVTDPHELLGRLKTALTNSVDELSTLLKQDFVYPAAATGGSHTKTESSTVHEDGKKYSIKVHEIFKNLEYRPVLVALVRDHQKEYRELLDAAQGNEAATLCLLNFSGLNLSGVDFSRPEFKDIDFRKPIFAGVDKTNVKFSDDQIGWWSDTTKNQVLKYLETIRDEGQKIYDDASGANKDVYGINIKAEAQVLIDTINDPETKLNRAFEKNTFFPAIQNIKDNAYACNNYFILLIVENMKRVVEAISHLSLKGLSFFSPRKHVEDLEASFPLQHTAAPAA